MSTRATRVKEINFSRTFPNDVIAFSLKKSRDIQKKKQKSERLKIASECERVWMENND